MDSNKIKPAAAGTNRYLFQVDIMIKDESNGKALEKLLHMLNNGPCDDYRINQGIQLGDTIEAALQAQAAAPNTQPAATTPAATKASGSAKPAAAAPKGRTAPTSSARPDASHAHSSILETFQSYMSQNKLIRLFVIKKKGVKLSIPCRILNIDESESSLSVYHVDEKSVYTFQFNEIEDFEAF